MPSRSGDADSAPERYREGACLELQMLRTFGDISFSETATAIVLKVFSITMSPVMDVAVGTTSGSMLRLVLKVYDRCYGSGLRQAHYKFVPLTAEHEALYTSYAQRGEMDTVIAELKERENSREYVSSIGHLLDGTDRGRVKYEASLWQEYNKAFDYETESYGRLRDVRG